jgi:mono/diheme cytochrome c family protein
MATGSGFSETETMMRSSLMRICAAAALWTLAGYVAADAQSVPGEPDPARGDKLAHRLCAVCHIPEEGAPRLQGTADVPTFPEIARMKGQSAERITGRIILPTHPMPQISLTTKQMEDIAAYILSLK